MKQCEKEIELQLEGTFLITLVYEFMGFQGVKEEKKEKKMQEIKIKQ